MAFLFKIRSRLRLDVAVPLVVVVNVLFFMAFVYHGVFTKHNRDPFSLWQHRFTQSQIEQGDEHGTGGGSIAPTNATFFGKKQKRKISEIKNYLNDFSGRNGAFYMGDRAWRYIMVNSDLCRDTPTIDVIIIVHTSPGHLEKRQRIRDSFAHKSKFLPFQVRVAFLLGLTSNKTLERVLWFEHTRYNDTVMGNFKDDYHNLTLKGVMGYRWVSEFCQNSRFVLKIDDDVMINMYKLLYSFMGHMNGKKKSIFCNLWYKNTMPILRKGKWRVKNELFHNKTKFPYDYCSGFMVIMTSDLMRPMYEAAKRTPFFWIDDLYLFGMLPSVVGGVTFHNYALRQNTTLSGKEAIKCTSSLGARCPIFAASVQNRDYWTYWNVVESVYSSESWKAKQVRVS